MYTLTRQEVADSLGISTRSVDRYVKAGKLRSKKEGKIIYIHEQDVAAMSGESQSNPEVIIKKPNRESGAHHSSESTHKSESGKNQERSTAVMDAQSRATLEKIYLDLRQEIKHKDQTIQDLSIRLGQAQEVAKNSVSLIDFKKSQFLLEESKGHLQGELQKLKEEKTKLSRDLKYEKNSNIILIVLCFVFAAAAIALFFYL